MQAVWKNSQLILSITLSLAASFVLAMPRLANAQEIKTTEINSKTSDQDELRLETIGYRISTSNADKCKSPEMMTGLIIHNLSDYDEQNRTIVAKSYDLTYGFGVISVVMGSNGYLSGLRPGDEIIAVNDKDLRQFGVEQTHKRASFDRTEKFENYLSDNLKISATILTVRRGSNYIRQVLQRRSGCGGRVTIDFTPELNAWSDGQYVAITQRLIHLAASDDEIAFVVAHEMAHNILQDFSKQTRASLLFAEFGIGANSIKKREIAADSYAISMIARAGYDPAASISFLNRSKQYRWLDLPITHPGISRRVALIENSIRALDISGGR